MCWSSRGGRGPLPLLLLRDPPDQLSRNLARVGPQPVDESDVPEAVEVAAAIFAGVPAKFFGRPSIPAQIHLPQYNRLSRDRDRWFESISLQQTVRLSPASAFEGREPRLPRGCPRLAWRPGRQRRAGCFDIVPTGGNISAGPYSSTPARCVGLTRAGPS